MQNDRYWTHYDGPIDAQSILGWLRVLDQNEVQSWTEDEILREVLTDFAESAKQRGRIDLEEMLRVLRPRVLAANIPIDFQVSLVEEGTELVSHIEGDQVHLYTQAIDYLGVITVEDSSLLKDLRDGKLSITVNKVDRDHNDVLLTLLINQSRGI